MNLKQQCKKELRSIEDAAVLLERQELIVNTVTKMHWEIVGFGVFGARHWNESHLFGNFLYSTGKNLHRRGTNGRYLHHNESESYN
jgi:hypothetical protein